MRARGRGSIVQLEKGKPKARCRRWQVRIYVGRNPHTGKEQTKTRRVNGTYTDAVQALDDLRTEVKGLEYTKGSDLSLSEAAKLYLERRQEGRAGMRPLAPASADKQRWALNAVVRELGDVPINSVTRRQVEDMLGSMQAGTGATGKRLSGAYCRTVFLCLEQLFAFCIREGLVEKDPTEHVAPPQNDTAPKRALGSERMAALVRSLDGTDRLQLAVLLMATCGLRRSEAAALKWGDVQDGCLVLGKSKTRAGLRRVPLMPAAESAIAARRSVLESDWGAGGMSLDGDVPLLCDEAGRAVTPHYLGVWWQKHRRDYGLEGWTLHELRHSFTSLLSETGASVRAMQELVGHASPSTTIGIYAHAGDGEKRAAVARAAEVLGGGSA